MTTFTTQDRQEAERNSLGVTKVKFANDSVESGWIYIAQTTARPLEDEQIKKALDSVSEFVDTPDGKRRWYDIYTFARAIERAHGIGE